MSTSFFLLLVPLWILRAQSLEVTNTSSCADICEGPSLTYSSDLSCSDDEYFTTANGDRMHDCLVCESTSSADNGDVSTPQNNDIYWFLCKLHWATVLTLMLVVSNDPSRTVPYTRMSSVDVETLTEVVRNSQHEVYAPILPVPRQWQHARTARMRSRLCWLKPRSPGVVVFARARQAICILFD